MPHSPAPLFVAVVFDFEFFGFVIFLGKSLYHPVAADIFLDEGVQAGKWVRMLWKAGFTCLNWQSVSTSVKGRMQSMHSASFVLMVKIMTSAKQKYRIFHKWMR